MSLEAPSLAEPELTPLEALVAAELDAPVPEGAHALAAELRARYGDNLRAVVMYGSNLRAGDDSEGLLDLYALVGSYDAAYPGRFLALANRLLPPNVFYLEATVDGRTVRSKYAVLALDDLPRLTSAATTEPYFWARFAQPCALVWATDDTARTRVTQALAGAIATFVRFGVPRTPSPFDSRALWIGSWRATYGAEVRPERPDATGTLYAANAARFERATALALPDLPWPVETERVSQALLFHVDVPTEERRRTARRWPRQRLIAKGRFLLRILRNALIFEGGVDYVLWKIERHSGVAVDPSWRERRPRWLALCAEAWRLYRARAFR